MVARRRKSEDKEKEKLAQDGDRVWRDQNFGIESRTFVFIVSMSRED